MNDSTYFGKRDGDLLHISEVESGLACDCVCPGCEDQLIAKKGDVVTHHFAHVGTPKRSCGEAAVHAFAKRAIARADTFVVPHSRTGAAATLAITRGEEEWGSEQDGERRWADAMLWPEGTGPFAVEVCNTHGSDEKRLAFYRRLGVPVLEVEVSDYAGADLETLTDRLLNSVTFKRWVWHPRHDREAGRVKAELDAALASVENERRYSRGLGHEIKALDRKVAAMERQHQKGTKRLEARLAFEREQNNAAEAERHRKDAASARAAQSISDQKHAETQKALKALQARFVEVGEVPEEVGVVIEHEGCPMRIRLNREGAAALAATSSTFVWLTLVPCTHLDEEITGLVKPDRDLMRLTALPLRDPRDNGRALRRP